MQFERQPRFPIILHAMLEDAIKYNFESIVSWVGPNSNGEYAFKIHNPKLFTEYIMQIYFTKQTKYKSFVRQLNLYGFQRRSTTATTDGDFSLRGTYSHPLFIRGNLRLFAKIDRKKPSRNNPIVQDELGNNDEEEQVTNLASIPNNFNVADLWYKRLPLFSREQEQQGFIGAPASRCPPAMTKKEVVPAPRLKEDQDCIGDTKNASHPISYATQYLLKDTSSIFIPEDMVADILDIFVG